MKHQQYYFSTYTHTYKQLPLLGGKSYQTPVSFSLFDQKIAWCKDKHKTLGVEETFSMRHTCSILITEI